MLGLIFQETYRHIWPKSCRGSVVQSVKVRSKRGLLYLLSLLTIQSCPSAADQPDFNLVSNNGYAQVVDHVHWHVRLILPIFAYYRYLQADCYAVYLIDCASPKAQRSINITRVDKRTDW